MMWVLVKPKEVMAGLVGVDERRRGLMLVNGAKGS